MAWLDKRQLNAVLVCLFFAGAAEIIESAFTFGRAQHTASFNH
jgi:hypothetical protein